MSKIAIVTASNGHNMKLANQLADIAKAKELETEIISLVDLNLPLYHPDAEKAGIPPAAVELESKLESARALIFIAPEYNGSFPPTLNNAVAWVSRSKEEWRGSFNGKITAIATHSGGGGAHALVAMRQLFSYIGANVLGRQLLTNYSKPLKPESGEAVFDEIIRLT